MLGGGPKATQEVRVAEDQQRRRRALSGPPAGRHAFGPHTALRRLDDSYFL